MLYCQNFSERHYKIAKTPVVRFLIEKANLHLSAKYKYVMVSNKHSVFDANCLFFCNLASLHVCFQPIAISYMEEHLHFNVLHKYSNKDLLPKSGSDTLSGIYHGNDYYQSMSRHVEAEG